MKRCMKYVSVLLLAGMLVSCGGSGDGGGTSGGNAPVTTSGGTPNTPPSGGDPATPPSGGTPVTPPGGGTPPPAGLRVEESDAAAVSLSAGWTPSTSRGGWSGGTAMESTVAAATASFTFNGTSVRWIGRRSKEGGIALVRVDGALVRVGAGPLGEVDLFARPNELRTPVVTIYDLPPGPHTLTIEVTGRQNTDALSNVVTVDAFEVEPQILSRLQETDPDAIYSGTWVQDPSSAWSGGGVATLGDPVFGGMRFAEAAGAKVTLKFRGTSIAWSGYRGPDAGIARVTLDGAASEVDTYSPKDKVQEVVFTATGLADKAHTLTIEATGRKNDASTGTRIVVDAFDVTTPGRRFEEDDPKIAYTGSAWHKDNRARAWTDGATTTNEFAGSRATFSFTGTSVSWIGCQKRSIGRSRIYIDGAFVKEVNNKRAEPIEGYQKTIYRADGLSPGQHTIAIEALGGGYTVVDAFDVHP
jgi:hypothetical protein